MHFKVSVFSSRDFEFFYTPQFVGDEYLIAVAVSPEQKVLNFTEIPVSDRKLSVHQQILAHLCDGLAQKLDPQIPVKVLFDCRAKKDPWQWRGLKALELNSQDPGDVKDARDLCTQFLLLKQKERSILFPKIEWKNESIKDHSKVLALKGNRAQYDSSHPEVTKIIKEADRKKKILVHVCCGPDAAGVVDQLKAEYEVICFWYDPNIQPRSEYDLRLDAFRKVARLKDVPTVIGEYDVDNFLEKIKGLEHTPEQGAKCSLCYDLRLERSAHEAKKLGCDIFTTTLAISPHKVQQKLKTFGDLMAKKYDIPYLARNFMKDDGFKESVKFTHDNEIYRQDYCGCWFSLYEGGSNAKEMAHKYGLSREGIASNTYSLPDEQT